MNIANYTLKVKGKTLLQNTDLHFSNGKINHIVGKNGVGKSQLAKDFLLNNSKRVDRDIRQNVSLISSSSNIPHDVSKDFLLHFLSEKFDAEMINKIAQLLNLDNIDGKVLIKNLSDGQKQKLKLLSFLLEDKNIIVLDEITNSLDKKTVMEIHRFLKKYIQENPEKIIINITHDLSDLKAIDGDNYIFHDQKIHKYDSVEKLIEVYINE
ncbi:ATP-binding cassette domain-containing protein [Bacillus atrophaeus]|uniref:ATP-binding cassette domain-containing protein n=1 Tax=Bacillus atrophaeus TaxID=1452 RepID=UPI001C625DA0|nr:ATP-binding cassette domain-containing protein [Bacillus atrophaeus]MCY8807982.1 ATP-binding cassette domain-containing protein [Bacillus atrophaeus]MCY8826079.1 ATP-binding cassette domain-containing protein [Bacillus atrophaeus]MCY8840451.1 ATP-binding cassette domain-containing protein [Bacillus atrophaeus]MEC0803602.1 ATP-binding cassette domain-containing protein [Bacillus atrophaeus]MEC0854203.1 ATP-binding cassette domain-containing protein [Bacillus atrophaeus]